MNNISMSTGIVSELRIATLLGTKNERIKCPCRVIAHVIERDVHGGILVCTVSVKGGAFVRARRAEFSEMSEILPDQYHQKTPADLFKKYLS